MNGWDDIDDEAVMLTMHQEDWIYSDLSVEEFKELWKSERYEPDGVYGIPLDKVDLVEVICEELKG